MESPNKWGKITLKDQHKDLNNAKKLKSFNFEMVVVFLLAAGVALFGGQRIFGALVYAGSAAALIGLITRKFIAITAAACLIAAAAAFCGLIASVACLFAVALLICDAVAVSK